MSALLWLEPDDDDTPFPSVQRALRDPDGLLAIGGSLSVRRLLDAYRQGIFPWYAAGQPVLWWSPDPRTVLFPEEIRIGRTLRRKLKRGQSGVSFDQQFGEVVAACAAPRRGQDGTWITDQMQMAYGRLHEHGVAHSVEVWDDANLVGGLYGVSLGAIFFGESMFSLVPDASKIGLAHLCSQLASWSFQLIDCQTRTEHLMRLGARQLPRPTFMRLLDKALAAPSRPGPWTLEEPVARALASTGTLAYGDRHR